MFKLSKMELPSEVITTMDISNDKDVLEILNHAVAEENIIIEAETVEDSTETEVEEIIEIIEEVEESEESEDSIRHAGSSKKALRSEDAESFEEHHQDENDKNSAEIFTVEEESLMFESEENNKDASRPFKTNTKTVVAYDVDEDWQDEDIDHIDEMENEVEENYHIINQHTEPIQRSDSNSISGSTSRIERSMRSMEDNAIQHEVVKNAENNLIYTVLGPRKQNTSVKQSQGNKIADAQYIKMEQLNENTIPVEGTIYYEGDNLETLYVAQPVEEESEQYQYENMEIDQEEQAWEASNSNPEQEQEEEENAQDQIFLHEDEDGQLYFKDDNGDLQPVYLTEDGNYAIADNSDDQDSQESQEQSQQISRLHEEENFTIPEPEHKSSNSKKQGTVISASELDSEDNTVTISLIISEDENGQKRTQVIIPTTDNMKCDICNKSFKTSFQLLRHNRLKHAREEDITTRNFPCDLCPKRYPDQNSLARHRKTHTGDRPFQCLECHKNFPTAAALRRHLTLHNSQSRPLPCIYCGRRFMEKASLVKHEQSHLPNEQRNHTCDVCHKTFTNSTDLSLHKKYHDPDKKFDCEVCGREFNRLNNLQRHMMVHQQQQGGNEEILSCDVCGITYKFMSSLTRHIVTSHMNPEKLKQQAEEQRRKRENNYRRYLENRKMYETQPSSGYGMKRGYHHNSHGNDEAA